jgi:hypothetical protein
LRLLGGLDLRHHDLCGRLVEQPDADALTSGSPCR